MFFPNYSFSCSHTISGSPVPMGPMQGPGSPEPYVLLTLHHPRHLLATPCPAGLADPVAPPTLLSAQPPSPFAQAQLPGCLGSRVAVAPHPSLAGGFLVLPARHSRCRRFSDVPGLIL